MPSASRPIRLGYVPLTDAAPLLAAEELGLFDRFGLHVSLVPVPSWASMRDRLAFGDLDGGQLLAPMPLAAALGLGGVRAELGVASVLSRNGNTLMLSAGLWAAIERAGPLPAAAPLPAWALARVVPARRAAGLAPLRLAVVYAFSAQNYVLRDWLAQGGLDPDADVALSVLPPPLMPAALANGDIDGFCAGEPWGSYAVDLRCGRMALATSQIRPGLTEKVLGLSRRMMDADADRAVSLVAALMQAGRWLEVPGNQAAAARLLHRRALPVPAALIQAGLAGRLRLAPDEPPVPVPPPVFFTGDATRPDPAQGAGWLHDMARWGHVPQGAAPDLAGLYDDRIWLAAAALAAGPLPTLAMQEA